MSVKCCKFEMTDFNIDGLAKLIESVLYQVLEAQVSDSIERDNTRASAHK